MSLITLRLRTLFKIEDLSIPKVPKGEKDWERCGHECFEVPKWWLVQGWLLGKWGSLEGLDDDDSDSS